MSIFKEISNTVKNIFNADDDVIFDEETEFKDEKQKMKFPSFSFGKLSEKQEAPNKASSFDISRLDLESARQNKNKNKGNGRIQVYVPKTFEEAFIIIKDVKAGFTAMVNVEVAPPQVSQRIVDLISGAIYALDGECKKMGEKQYIFSLSAETVGAMDYLPVNGAQPEMSQKQPIFNMNMNMQQPFSFLNPMQQNPTNNNNFNNFDNNIKMDDLKSYYVPPKSQF